MYLRDAILKAQELKTNIIQRKGSKNPYSLDQPYLYSLWELLADDWEVYIEKPKEITITREKLGAAWDYTIAGFYKEEILTSDTSCSFEKLCKKLGL